MIITVEISYYPLTENYSEAINSFLEKISKSNITIEVGMMSTVLIGEYKIIFELLNNSIYKLMEDYSSVFNMKISNSCPIK